MERPPEVALPAGSLTAIRDALRAEAGPLVAIHALQVAGHETGGAMFEGFRRWVGDDPRALRGSAFWDRLGRYLKERGWGDVEHSTPHRGVGIVRARQWAEARKEGGEAQPTCAFSAGMFSGFLTHAAGAPVAVLEVACASTGDDTCDFAFGSEATIHDLYGLLLEGKSLAQALKAL